MARAGTSRSSSQATNALIAKGIVAPLAGWGASPVAFTFNGEPFTFGSAAFIYGAS